MIVVIRLIPILTLKTIMDKIDFSNIVENFTMKIVYFDTLKKLSRLK